MTSREVGYALLALLIALAWSAWDWIEYEWGGLTEGQRAAIVTACAFVAAWALWPLAAMLWKFVF